MPGATLRQRGVGGGKDEGKVEPCRGILVEQLAMADDLVERARAQPGQVLAHLFCDQEEVVDDVLRLAFELRAQIFALRRDACRACVEVTLPRHIAAERYQHSGAEAELLGAEQRSDDDVASAAQDRKSTRLNSSHVKISYAVFCLKKK